MAAYNSNERVRSTMVGTSNANMEGIIATGVGGKRGWLCIFTVAQATVLKW